MAAYLIANLRIHAPAVFAEYRAQVEPMIHSFGGRYLVRGGAIEELEGAPGLERLIILEFPDMARLKTFYGSAEYAPLIALRQSCAESDVALVEGYAP